MSTTYRCETCGSDSATSDYCDMCGAAILGQAAPAPPMSSAAGVIEPPDLVDPAFATPPPASAAPAGESGATCYFCGAPRSPGDEVCDVCGVDFVSGRMGGGADPTPVPPADPTPVPTARPRPPTAVPAPPFTAAPVNAAGDTLLPDDTFVIAAPARWTAVVAADRSFFDGNVTAGVVNFPDGLAPREFPLLGNEVTIGRRSESKGYQPDIDLSAPVDDPAVSRRHAVFQRQGDGSLAVLDVGSTNGTWLNDEDEALAHGVPRSLEDGDRLLLGAFTCITVHSDPPAPRSSEAQAAPPPPPPLPPPPGGGPA
jgi:hypothetical protein